MTWLGTPEFKVGALVVLVSGLIGVMSIKVAEGPGILSGKKTHHFTVDSAGGLVRNSAVKMAGIKIGVIDDIVLENGRAKIVVAVDGDALVTSSSRAGLKSDGILGDKHVEISPGSPTDPALPNGSEIPLGKGSAGMDEMMADVGRVAKSMNQLMETLNKAAGEGDKTTTIGRIIENIEIVSADLRDITGDNKEKINEIVDRIRNLSKNIDEYINEDSLAHLDNALKNIDEITSKVNKGEGTLGRLINDEQTIDELNSAITQVNKFLGGANQMETSVDFHSEYLSDTSQTKSFLGLRLQPGLDRYYEIFVIDDPEGVKQTESSVSTEDGVPHTSTRTKTFKNKLKFTALFAKNFWDLTIKGGIMENNGGVGVDYHFLNRDLRLSAEFFNFQEAQLRLFARYNFFKGVYVITGGDNLLSNDDGEASFFVGAGIFITNDDLKTLASRFSL